MSPRIFLLLAAITLVVGVNFFIGYHAANKAERKGYPLAFGFLMGFYFSVLGFLVVDRMKPYEPALKLRELEDARYARKEPVPPSAPWSPVWTGRKPNFVPVYALLGITMFFGLFLQNRSEDLGGGGITLVNIPYDRGDWKYDGESNQDDSLMQQIKADAYTMRYYHNVKTGQSVQLYLVYRRYGRREFNHNPDQCFPAGGYRLISRDTAKMPWAGGERNAVHMVFDGRHVLRSDDKEGVPEATVCYFFASGHKTEYVFLRQQMWMAMERLLPNKNGWALIRLNSPRVTTDADALAAQQEFMREYGPTIQQTITTDAEGDATQTVAATP